jgi:hypothetical protein
MKRKSRSRPHNPNRSSIDHNKTKNQVCRLGYVAFNTGNKITFGFNLSAYRHYSACVVKKRLAFLSFFH